MWLLGYAPATTKLRDLVRPRLLGVVDENRKSWQRKQPHRKYDDFVRSVDRAR
jgi:hypothetical protein